MTGFESLMLADLSINGQCKVCGTTLEGNVGKLRAHTSDCKHVDPDVQLASLAAQDAKNSTQNTLHKSKITPARMQLLMCLAIIMNGWAFRIVGGARFADFLANLRPSFSPSGNAARALQLCDAVQPCACSIV